MLKQYFSEKNMPIAIDVENYNGGKRFIVLVNANNYDDNFLKDFEYKGNWYNAKKDESLKEDRAFNNRFNKWAKSWGMSKSVYSPSTNVQKKEQERDADLLNKGYYSDYHSSDKIKDNGGNLKEDKEDKIVLILEDDLSTAGAKTPQGCAYRWNGEENLDDFIKRCYEGDWKEDELVRDFYKEQHDDFYVDAAKGILSLLDWDVTEEDDDRISHFFFDYVVTPSDIKLDENLSEAKGKLDDALPELKELINEHKNSIIEYGEALKQGNVKNPNYKDYTTRFVFDVYYFLKGRGFNIYKYIDENDLRDDYLKTLMKKALSGCGIKITLEEDLDTFNDKMDFLAKDEDEAIDGYKKVIKTIDNKNVKTQLGKIEKEEKAHKDYLEKVKKNKNVKYTEPLMDEE